MNFIKRYIKFVRQQNDSIKHAHAFLFAFIVTMFFIVYVLYNDYGFFRTTYDKDKTTQEETVNENKNKIESPFAAFTNIFNQAGKMISEMNSTTTNSVDNNLKISPNTK